MARVELGARDLRRRQHAQRQAGHRHRASTCSPAPTRCRSRRPCSETMDELQRKRFPAGVDYDDPVRHHALRRGLDRGSDQDLRRGVVLVVLVVFLFLQSCARHADPDASRCRCRSSAPSPACCARLLDQPADAVRPGARHRHRGRRRHRRARERRAHHATRTSSRRARPRSRRWSEVTGPVVAIVLVLCAVFIPVAFLRRHRRPALPAVRVTIAISVVISGFVALTLTPALCALLLKPDHRRAGQPFCRCFNRGFDR